jgi:hypothetical protein
VTEGKGTDLPIHIRGSHRRLGKEPVPRGALPLFDHCVDQPEIPGDGSGRLQLAQWLTDPAHPLTARVMVNRIWQGHFGVGLVPSSSNFGSRGDTPSHPQLLDHLALAFIDSGWSIKAMHRMLMLSETWQASSAPNARGLKTDPENTLLWRQNRRRLELEPIRDSLLAVSGKLDRRIGGSLKLVPQDKPNRYSFHADNDNSNRRTLYMPMQRANTNVLFGIFDYADPSAHVDRRPVTIVAQQALFMMNSPTVLDQASALAKTLGGVTETERLSQLYVRLYARPPRAEEIERGEDFLAAAPKGQSPEQSLASLIQVLMAADEFIFVD